MPPASAEHPEPLDSAPGELEGQNDEPSWSYLEDMRQERPASPAESLPKRRHRSLWYSEVPSSAARDFLARERNLMSWVRLFLLMAVLSSAMFTELQLQDLDKVGYETLLGIAPPSAAEPEPEAVALPAAHHMRQAVFQLPGVKRSEAPAPVQLSATRKVEPVGEYRTLGIIYLVTAFIAWVVSVVDYFTCIRQLETEHTYLDECEGHTHPAVTLMSCLVCAVLIGTAILMLVQRET